MLWFEHDLYDQLQLVDVLTLAHAAEATPELVVVGAFPGKPPFAGLGELTAGELETLWPARRWPTHVCAAVPNEVTGGADFGEADVVLASLAELTIDDARRAGVFSMARQPLAYSSAVRESNSNPTTGSSPTTQASCPGSITYDWPARISCSLPSSWTTCIVPDCSRPT